MSWTDRETITINSLARDWPDERQRLIRLVVARDWAVMIQCCFSDWQSKELYMENNDTTHELSCLPCAEDFVDAMLGWGQ